MKKYCFLLFCTLFMLQSNAQRDGSIQGILQDTALQQPLANATVSVLLAKDSSLVSFTRTNASGAFSIRNLPLNNYRVLITHVGYNNSSRQFTLSETLRSFDFGILPMTNKSSLLAEVTVTQEKPPVIIRNDTLEFNAGSFATKPNAVVEDLLKKLPGVQVDKDGKIKANGEEVKRVLVDGKEFFGNDPKMATKNLPADAIDKVQVFDRKSDQARFSGFDDGNTEKTINLTVKPEKKNGVFGKATAGAGDKGLYQGNYNINSFNKERQLSSIGMLNNTNKQGFSFLDILNFTGGLPGAGRGGNVQMDMGGSGLPVQGAANNQGITSTRAGGINYNNSWQQSLDFTSSYFYNRLQTDKLEDVFQQWLLPGNNYTTNRHNSTGNSNQNHRLNLSADYKIDSLNTIKYTTAVNRQASVVNSNSNYMSLGEAGNLLNEGSAAAVTAGKGYSWNNNLLLRHRFARKGRTFSANLSYNKNEADASGSLQSVNSYYQPSGSLQQRDTINQVNDQADFSNSYGALLSYTEPLSKKSLLEFNYNINSTRSTAARHTYDFDALTNKHSALNNNLSSNFTNAYTFSRPGLHWRFQQNKYNVTVGAAMEQGSLQSSFHAAGGDSAIHASFLNLLPRVLLQYKINQYKNLRAAYNTSTKPPSVTQLQPLTDNTDPLNVKMGNPDLRQEYYHRLQAEYISFDPYRHTSFFAGLSAGLTNNKIVNADELTTQGQRVTKPVNANGVYNASFNSSWGFPFRKLDSKLNLNTGLSASHNLGFINGAKNGINSFTASQELVWNYTYKDRLELAASAAITYNDVKYSLQRQQNLQYWNQYYTMETNLYLPGGWSLATDIDYNKRSGLTQGYNLHAFIWNAGLAKQLFASKKGELRLQVYDILNQNIGVSRNSNQNYVEDISYNVLKRFWQLSFTYNISRFAGKNMTVSDNRNGNIQVIEEGKRR